MTSYDVHRPIGGDVIDLIIADHYLMEHLLRQMRDDSGDREAARLAFAAVHVAHAEAEERHVYPALRKRAAEVGGHEVEHGKEEHAEGTEALLAVMELKGTDTKAYEDAVEELSRLASHHLVEEELTILNPARGDVPLKDRPVRRGVSRPGHVTSNAFPTPQSANGRSTPTAGASRTSGASSPRRSGPATCRRRRRGSRRPRRSSRRPGARRPARPDDASPR